MGLQAISFPSKASRCRTVLCEEGRCFSPATKIKAKITFEDLQKTKKSLKPLKGLENLVLY